MKRIGTFIAATCLLFASIQVTAAIDTLLHIDDATLRQLRYHTVENGFDSAVAVLQLGEIRIRSGASISRIALDVRTPEYEPVMDMSGTPVQSTLLPYLRSERFIMVSDADSLILFRQIGAKLPRKKDGSSPSTWKFDDRTVFVTVVKDASTHEALWTLDSVGIDAIVAMDTLIPYIGEGTRSARVVRAIPAHVRNRPVYVQVVPYRYGTSPYGMNYGWLHTPISCSAMYGDGYTLVSPKAMEELLEKQFDRYMAFAEGLYTRYCSVPPFQGLYFRPERVDSIQRRFFEIDTIMGSDTAYRVKPCDEVRRQRRLNDASNPSSDMPTVVRCHVANRIVHLELRGGKHDATIVLEVADERERNVEAPWMGTIGAGDRMSVAIPMPSVSGSALASVRSAAGQQLSVHTLLFE